MTRLLKNQDNVIRLLTVGIALLVFFVGPHFVQIETAETVQKLIVRVSKEKRIPTELRIEIVSQLRDDMKFIKENQNAVKIGSSKIPAVYALSLLIILIGWLVPPLVIYLSNKRIELVNKIAKIAPKKDAE